MPTKPQPLPKFLYCLQSGSYLSLCCPFSFLLYEPHSNILLCAIRREGRKAFSFFPSKAHRGPIVKPFDCILNNNLVASCNNHLSVHTKTKTLARSYRQISSMCRHGSSVDLFAPTILRPWVWIPGTPSGTLFTFTVKFGQYLTLYCEKNNNKQKESC